MFIDARQIESDSVVEADLCIIGGGAAGITLAREFLGTGVKVCLLESGGLDFAWNVQELSKGASSGLPYFALDMAQLRYFGGNTNGWGGWCRPLEPGDFRRRSWVADSGWPFERSELDPFYLRAEKVCGVEPHDWDLQSWLARLDSPRARLLPFAPDKIEHALYRFSRGLRFGLIYRSEIDGSDNVRCLLNAHVFGLHAGSDARRLAWIEAGTLSGKRFTVRAKSYVLAAGGIENARLLLLSNDVAPRGLGNDADLVGRYFMEHPHIKRRVIAIDRRAPVGLYSLAFYHQSVALRLSLPEEVQQREGLLAYSANLHPFYYGHDKAGWLAFRKFVLSLMPSRKTDPFIRFPPMGPARMSAREVADIIRELPMVTVAALLQKFQPIGFLSHYILETKPEQAPNRESRVLLDETRDAFGLNRVRLDWKTTELDRRTALRGDEIVGEELARLGIGRLEPLPPDEAEATGPWPANFEGGWHQIGTTRMHEEPRHGVVDADCRVHGMENLFITGSSVFPTEGVAPPTLTIVALALRLAGHLKSRFAEEPSGRAVAVAAREKEETVSG